MNLKDHERIQQDIAAYLADRLLAERREEVRVHLDSCESCRGVVDSWTPVVRGFRIAGEAILEPHPESGVLLAYAHGKSDGSALAAHLDTCPSCRLEVEGARAGLALADAGPAPVRRAWRTAAVALAAGLVLGLALAGLFLRQGDGLPVAGGPIQLYSLEEAVRSDGEGAVLEVEPGSRVLPLVLLPAVPPEAPSGSMFTLELRDGQGGVVWSDRYAASELHRYLEVSGVLTLLVPVQPDGPYTLRLLSEDEPGDGPLQEFRFTILQR